MKLLLPKKLLKIMFIALLFVGQYSIGQTTIVNYNFNSGSNYATLNPTLAPNIISTATSTEAFSTFGGTASGAGAFTANTTPGNALAMQNSSGTNTKYFQFQLGGSALNTYSLYKIYLQAQRSGTGAQTLTISYSTNGSIWTNFGTTRSPGNGLFSEASFDLSSITDINSQSVVYFRVLVSAASGSGTLRVDNFQIQATAAPTAPIVTTVAASSITTTDAIISGTINANGFTVASSFEYGTTTSYGTTEVGDPASVVGTTTTEVDAIIGSLAVNTLYNYRAVGSVSGTPTNGANMSFYTLAATPGVLVVSNPTQNTLDVAVTATTQNSNPAATLYAIQETGGQYVQANGTLGATAVWQTASTWATVTVAGLSSSTLYTFQTKARNGATVPVETIFGATASGTTTAPATPVVTAGAPTGTYNASFSYSITASNTATSYALSSGTLPLGLSLNTTTGVISGTPTEVGTFNTNFTASNAGGTSAPAAVTITINKANQTITFAALSAVTYGDASFALTGSSDSSLAISYSSSDTNVATVLGTSVTIVGPGITTIEATQTGNANYNAAVAVGRTLTVNKKTVTISGLVADNKVQDGNSLATLSGTASIVGVINSDDVILNGIGIGTFASSAPGIGIAVSVNGYSLSGVDSANYTLTQPTGLTADITALDAPVATAATAVGVTSFTANWDAVADATSYEIDVYEETIAYATDLFISEYGEGSGGNKKYIEIFNGTGASVDLANYEIWLISNGGSWTESTISLSGTLANNASYVIANNDTDVIGANLYNANLNFNGDDAVGLAYNGGSGSSFVLIDAIGEDGSDPVAGWYVAGIINATVDKILTRKSTILSPNTNWGLSSGTDATNSEWIVSSFTYNNTNQTTNLGSHTFNGGTTTTYVINAMNVGNVTTYEVTGLNANTTYHYRVRAVLGSATSVNSNVIDVTTADDTCVWSSLAWSNVTGPTEEIEATIVDAYDTTTYGEITAKKLTIDTAGSLVINSGTNVYVMNEVINNASASALLVESNGNLLQINDVSVNVNVGNITVNRETSELKRLDYVLWSSPVVGQLLQPFSPATLSNRFYTYDAGTNLYALVASPSTTSFSVGTGFLIRTPNNHPTTPAIWSSVFTGLPHNGDFSVAVANDTYNAVGNPYPSVLDADQFMVDNAITEALYFWRKENNSANASYATYTSFGATANTGGGSSLVPTYAIQVGQGFIAKSTSTSLNFTNSMRVADNDNLFLKSSNTVDKSRLWLDLTNTDGLFCQTLIGYMSTATSGVDSRIDGRIFSQPTNGATLTSIIGNDSSYIIQGKGTFVDTDVVPLAFKTAVSGNFTIALSNVDGLFANNAQDVFLKDNLTNTITNLTNGDYTFATAIGDYLNRFEVVYQSTVLNTDNFTSNNLVVYTQANGIVINAGSDLLSNVKVFDVRGRLLLEKANLNDSEVVLNISKSNEVLLVQVTNQYGNVITKKVIN